MHFGAGVASARGLVACVTWPQPVVYRKRTLMASKTLVILEDDLSGGKADETITFSLDGVAYEIDLSTKNAANLRDALDA